MPGLPASTGPPRGGLSGRTLGEFVVKDKLGEGGFGEVYRAEQPALGREAVVKVLRPRHHASPEITQRFLREAKVASRIDHPYAAHIYAFGAEPDGVLWIAMELVRGTPLSAILEDAGRLPLSRLVPLLDRLCEVVHTAHEQGIVHRDLKPANVMVIARAGRMLPKLLDLGIAKLTGEPEGEGATFDADAAIDERGDTMLATGKTPPVGSLTRRGDLVGSPRYMAPEQWVASASVDRRADVYSLGILAYEALTGQAPFSGETVGALARAHASSPVPPVGEGFPVALDAVFRRALGKTPDARFSDTLELAAAFRAASGLASESEAIPRLADEIRERWLADAPQPLAEAVAALDGARNAHQAREAAYEVARLAARWLALLAIAARTRLAGATLSGSEGGRRTVDAMKRRHVTDEDWLAIARDLARAHVRRPDAHPIPELVRFLSAEADPFAPFLGVELTTSAEDVLGGLGATVPALARLLGALGFLLEYPLVVPAADGSLELWMGVRKSPRRVLAPAARPLEAARVHLLDLGEQPVLSLWPIVQAWAPTPGAADELFLLDGRGQKGARMVALPRGFERQDPVVWDWFGTELVGEEPGAKQAEPYRGLAAFTAGDAELFIGRERETEALLNRLVTTTLIAVVGPSGAGKSSFVQAGVVPELPDRHRALILRPGPAPLGALAARLDADGAAPAADLGDRLRAHARARGETLVLVVDQLEEIFTLCLDPAQRLAFAEALVRAARAPEDPVRVILTLRDDFLTRLGELAPLRERVAYGQGLQLLGTPSEEDLLRIVTVPAERAGYGFDDAALPGLMVEAVAERPGALALLSFTAARLWERRDRHFKLLGRRAYDELGGVAGALARHAEETRASLTHEEQRLVREAFRHLVTAEGTRAVLSRAELEETLGGGSPARTVVDKLIDARLLVATEGDGPAQLEVIHEALLSAWPRLVEWRREDAEGARLRDQLRAAARQWDERGRPRGLLWRDEALAELVRWRARFPGTLTSVEDAFREASQADAARGLRTRRLVLGGIISGLAVGLVVTMTLARRASDAQGRAEAGLVHQYQEQGRQLLLAGDATRAYPYLVEAHRRGGPNPALMFLLGRAGRMLDRQLLTLRHGGPVNDVAYTPDGTRIVTASDDKAARIWDATSGELLHTLPHEDKVYTFAFSPDGRRLATASYDKTAAIWDLATGQRLVSLVGHEGRVYAVAWSPDGTRLATGGHDQTARVWDVASGRALATMRGHTAQVRGVSFSPDGRRLFTVAREPTPRLWDAASGQALPLAVKHDDLIFASAAQGEWLATASRDSSAMVFTEAGAPTRLLGHLGMVRSIGFSPDGRQVVTTGNDESARIWSLPAGDRVIPLMGHIGTVEFAEFDRTGTRVVTASDDATARVWDAVAGRALAVLAGHTDMVWRARFSPDGQRVVTASFDGTATVWNPDSGELGERVAAHPEGSVRALVIRPDGAELVTAGADGHARIWTFPALVPVTDVPLGEAAIGAAYTPSGRLLIVGERRLFVRDHQRTRSLALPAGEPSAVAVDGEEGLILGRTDGTIAEWHPGDPSAIATFPAHDGEVTSVALLPGAILSTGGDGVARLGARQGGGLRFVVRHPNQAAISRAAASPDGELLVTAGQDRTAILWRTRDGRRERTLEGHTNILLDAVFSPTGDFVATASHDASARIWDVRTGEVLVVFPAVALDLVAFDPATTHLVAATNTGEIVHWRIDAETRSTVPLMENLACRVPFSLVEGYLVPRPQRDCHPQPKL